MRLNPFLGLPLSCPTRRYSCVDSRVNDPSRIPSVNVVELPGLAQLPYAEVWLHEVDDGQLAAAFAAARAIGKTGLEVWTTTRTPEVVDFLVARDFEVHRRYVISELDVSAA